MSASNPGPVAERVVLAALIDGTDSDYFSDALALLSPAAFTYSSHQLVFTAITDLFLDGVPVGLESVREQLARKDNLEAAGGYPALTALTTTLFSEPVTAPRQYLANLVDDFTASSTAHKLQTIASGLGGSLTLDEARNRVDELFSHPSRSSMTLPSIDGQVEDFGAELDEMRRNPGAQRGVPTGWQDLDGGGDRRPIIGGLRPGWLIYIAARPSVGKTVVLLDWIRTACKAGVGAYFASSEMSSQEIMQRLVAAECHSVQIDVLTRQPELLSNSQYEQVQNAMALISEWPLVIDDTASDIAAVTRGAAGARARFRSTGNDLGIVFQDYVQLLNDPPGLPPSQTDVVRIGRNSAGLKQLGRKMEVPVVAAAQIKRLPEGAIDRPPRADDLKGAGNLEQDADVLIGLHRPYATDPARSVDGGGPPPEDMKAIMLKFRHGQGGTELRRTFLGYKSATTEPMSGQDHAALTSLVRQETHQPQHTSDWS